MVEERNCILSVAGFDPSGGAGLLADIKTFEAHNICGMGVMSALTFQNDAEFDDVKWIDAIDIVKQITVLKRRFKFIVIKIGLIQNLETLQTIGTHCPSSENCWMIWDPVIRASAGFKFHEDFEGKKLFSLLQNIFLITPNIAEVKLLSGEEDPVQGARRLSAYCNVLLKGGHNTEDPGVDYLFTKNKVERILPSTKPMYAKHGSGCVLSSAIAANFALGHDLVTSCRNAKNYVENFLSSHRSLLGFHHV